MTMPNERARAMIWMVDTLKELHQCDAVPADFQRKLEITMRHYPSRAEIEEHALQAAHEGHDLTDPWMLPMKKHRMDAALEQSIFERYPKLFSKQYPQKLK